jgi:hypothetical protein
MPRRNIRYIKNGLLTGLTILFCWTNSFAQCNDYFEWAEDHYKKEKYSQAIKYCHQVLEHCTRQDARAGACFFLMNIYKEYLPNDSLYIYYKKTLVRSGYEYPRDYRITYVSNDPYFYAVQTPDIDLYPISRELCCELYDRKEYDSAYYYFNQYADRYSSKGWCGFGTQNDHLYDNIIRARLSAVLGDTAGALQPLVGYLTPDASDQERDYYLMMFCFYDNVYSMWKNYKRGDLLQVLTRNIVYDSYKASEMRFHSSFRGYRLSFTEACKPGEMIEQDTLAIMERLFHNTMLCRVIFFQEQLKYDQQVTFRGTVHTSPTDTTFWSDYGITFQLEGWKEVNNNNNKIELTAMLVNNEREPALPWWSSNSSLVFPERKVERKLRFINYKSME